MSGAGFRGRRLSGALAAVLAALPAFGAAASAQSFDGSGAPSGTLPAFKLSAARPEPSPAELVAAIENRDGKVGADARLAALWKLGRKEDSRDQYLGVFIADLVGPDADPDPGVRGIDALILSQVKREKDRARAALAQALDPQTGEKDPEAQIQILYAAAKTKDPRFTPNLIAVVTDTTRPLNIRAVAALALRQDDRKKKESVPALMRVYLARAPLAHANDDILLGSAGYTLRLLAPMSGAAWMVPGQNIIERLQERHPNLPLIEMIVGYVAGKYL